MPAAHRAPSLSISMPQVGIASALGIATIAAPLTGSLATPAAKVSSTTTTTSVSAAISASPAFPLKIKSALSVAATTLLPDDTPATSVPSSLAAPRTVIVDRASRSNERSVLPGCTGQVASVTYANGHVPSSQLCTLWDKHYQLRADAAVALAKLNILYKQKFGHDLRFSSAYRTYAQQVAVKAARGSYAAAPGSSNHGWGLAVDLKDVQTYNATYYWLRANAPAFGFDSPDWARPGGSLHEPWHWEYTGAVASLADD